MNKLTIIQINRPWRSGAHDFLMKSRIGNRRQVINICSRRCTTTTAAATVLHPRKLLPSEYNKSNPV